MISIIGSGNVATHLFEALRNKIPTALINPRTLQNLNSDSQVILICVSDNAITEVVRNLPPTKAIVAHTAGSIPMDVLKNVSENYGVFYPLQTFTKNIPLDYSKIPVFIEANNSSSLKKLKEVATLFSNDVREADSRTRKKLHLASVFACNFTNALAGVSSDLLKDTGIDFSALLPLLQQTVEKLTTLDPHQAQTGPAVRGDSKVIDSHLSMLSNQPSLQRLYALLSSVINPSLNFDNLKTSQPKNSNVQNTPCK